MEIIEYIDLVFENCEKCTLLPDMFKNLVINGIKENTSINCFQYENGEISKDKSCEYFSITVNEKGLSLITWNGTLRERLMNYKDIVSVIIHYENRTEEIYVPWHDEDEYSNRYQKAEKTEEGIKIDIEREKV